MIGSGWVTGCIEELISLSWVGCENEPNLEPGRIQEFEAQQRTGAGGQSNRSIDSENTNKMTQFSKSARILTKDSVNRSTSVSKKTGKTTFKSKNRTIH